MSSDSDWDVVVIGAGPAGALAAFHAATAKLRTLLVDRGEFPRNKVCGSCISLRALATLQRVGLACLEREVPGEPLRQFRVQAAGRSVTLGLPGGVAVARDVLDAQLVRHAVKSGAVFRSATVAEVLPGPATDFRDVGLFPEGRRRDRSVHRARVVVVADGLGHPSLRGWSEFQCRVTGTKVGLGAILEQDEGFYRPGTVYMAVGRSGYVGVVRLRDGRLNVAAALEHRYLRGGAQGVAMVQQVLSDSGLPVPRLSTGCWRGTRQLTRRASRVSGRRMFLVGDAAGYVEPFTGEGIATALDMALAAGMLVRAGAERWDQHLEREWERIGAQVGLGRQRACRYLVRLLRYPGAVSVAINVLARYPTIANSMVRRINAVRPGSFRGYPAV